MGDDPDRRYEFPEVKLEVPDFESAGFILDIGGGGEGVIGRLKGRDVVAIDIRREELEEAAAGPLKIVMDARDLKFLDQTFGTATAFFALMYIRSREDQQQVLAEAWRVLKPGGMLHVWETDLAERPATDTEGYVVRLRYRVRGFERGTGYATRWPDEPRGEAYYRTLGRAAGFSHVATERIDNVIYLQFRKDAGS